MEASGQIQDLLVSAVVASMWQLFSLSTSGQLGPKLMQQTETEEII